MSTSKQYLLSGRQRFNDIKTSGPEARSPTAKALPNSSLNTSSIVPLGPSCLFRLTFGISITAATYCCFASGLVEDAMNLPCRVDITTVCL